MHPLGAGYPELHVRAWHGDQRGVAELLAAGNAANLRGAFGRWTALHVAAGQGHVEVLKLLLEARADSSCTDGDGDTPADWAHHYEHGHAVMALQAHEEALRATSSKALIAHHGVVDLPAGDRADIELLRGEMADARGRFSAAESRVVQLERELERAAAANIAASERAAELERQLSSARSASLTVEARSSMLERQLAELQSKAQHSASVDVARLSDLESQVGALEQIRHQSSLRIEALQQQLAQLNQELAAARTPRSADVLGKVAVAIARSGRAGQEVLAGIVVGQDGLPLKVDLERGLLQICQAVPESDLQSFLGRFGNGDVEACEFVKGLFAGRAQVLCAARVQDTIARLAAAMARLELPAAELFQKADANNDGRLSMQELEAVVLRLQPDLSDEERRLLFARFDADASGQVDINEFTNALQGATADGILARIAASVKRLGATPEELFIKTDANRDGTVSIMELERLLLKVEPGLSDLERLHLFSRFDRDGSGEIDIGEFCVTLTQSSARPRVANRAHAKDVISRMAESLSRLKKLPKDLFVAADSDGNGRISFPELDSIVVQMQPDLSAADRQELFKSFDTDNSGEVDLSEFCRAMEDAVASHEEQHRGSAEAEMVSQLQTELQSAKEELARRSAECDTLRDELSTATEDAKASRDRAAAAARAWGR